MSSKPRFVEIILYPKKSFKFIALLILIHFLAFFSLLHISASVLLDFFGLGLLILSFFVQVKKYLHGNQSSEKWILFSDRTIKIFRNTSFEDVFSVSNRSLRTSFWLYLVLEKNQKRNYYLLFSDSFFQDGFRDLSTWLRWTAKVY